MNSLNLNTPLKEVSCPIEPHSWVLGIQHMGGTHPVKLKYDSLISKVFKFLVCPLFTPIKITTLKVQSNQFSLTISLSFLPLLVDEALVFMCHSRTGVESASLAVEPLVFQSSS